MREKQVVLKYSRLPLAALGQELPQSRSASADKLTVKPGKAPVETAYWRNMAGTCLAEDELSPWFPQTAPSLFSPTCVWWVLVCAHRLPTQIFKACRVSFIIEDSRELRPTSLCSGPGGHSSSFLKTIILKIRRHISKNVERSIWRH